MVKHVLWFVFWIQLIPVVNSVRNIRVQNRFRNIPGIKIVTFNLQAIGKNSNDCPPLRRSNKQLKQIISKGFPKEILSKLSNAGANVSKVPGEALYVIDNMRFGDEAWKIFETYAESAPTKPLISILFGPTEAVRNTSVIPADNLVPAIIVEASSICGHYAALNVSALAGDGVPAIPKPAAFSMIQVFNTTDLTLSKLFERIQNPNHPEYPVITALPSGSYICTVAYDCQNAALMIAVFKP